MEVSMSGLLQTSLYALVLGIAFGALYDVVRVIKTVAGVALYYPGKTSFNKIYERGVVNIFSAKRGKIASSVITAVLDVLFFTFAGVSFVLFLYCNNYGIFRWFILFCAAAGFRLYYISLGKVTVYFFERVSELVKLLLNLALFAFIYPFRKLYRVIHKVFLSRAVKLFRRLFAALDKKRKKRYTLKCISKLSEFIKL
ncbi:MAG: spore cortex biosynthesis protein YabQ [Clostridia bacterium]|nr:spore cortex biosynthesis protein YabQ [Clostridia bacterium]